MVILLSVSVPGGDTGGPFGPQAGQPEDWVQGSARLVPGRTRLMPGRALDA